MATAIFKINEKEIQIQCCETEKMKDIFKRLNIKMGNFIDNEKAIFFYEGYIINNESTFIDLSKGIKKVYIDVINPEVGAAPTFVEKILEKKTLELESSSSEKDNENHIHNEKEKDIIQNENIASLEKNEPKKFNLNILYYDENLKDDYNNENCAFFEMNIKGTFYGCHYFELFKIVCEKITKSKKEFILITSGSLAKKIFDYCSDIDQIREYFIYCFNQEKYIPLMKEYSKLKGVYNDFHKLKEKLYDIKQMKIGNISSSNLIYFEDYIRIYIKLHYEFIRKYKLYKSLKSKNCNESQFFALVEKVNPYYLDLAKQIFPNKEETIKFFRENTKESEETLNKIFQVDDNVLSDNIKIYIKNYTNESFYYLYLNKFLREGNFDAFRKLSSHLAKFIYKLYDYREKNICYQKQSNLYRKMYLDPKDIKLYKESTGKVICYPAFTSTSLNHEYHPQKYNENHELVLLEIEQNNTKFNVSISKDSVYETEEEYLFLPFSFFKIKYVELKEGNDTNPHLIHLIALNSEKTIEEMFVDFMENETDNLNPEGLDLLLLENDSTELVFNPIYLSKKKDENKDKSQQKRKRNNHCKII